VSRPAVTVRTLTEDDVPALAALLAANRRRGRGDPAGVRGGRAAPAAGRRLLHHAASLTVLRRNGFTPLGVAPRYLRIGARGQDHLLFQLLADETGTPGMR
jgi:hypothetical protein